MYIYLYIVIEVKCIYKYIYLYIAVEVKYI